MVERMEETPEGYEAISSFVINTANSENIETAKKTLFGYH